MRRRHENRLSTYYKVNKKSHVSRNLYLKNRSQPFWKIPELPLNLAEAARLKIEAVYWQKVLQSFFVLRKSSPNSLCLSWFIFWEWHCKVVYLSKAKQATTISFPEMPSVKGSFWLKNCADKKGLEVVNGELLRVRRLLTARQPRTFHEIRVKLFAKSLAIWGPFFAKLSTPEHDNTIAFKMKTGSFLMKQDFSCSSCRWSSRSTSWSRRFRLTWLPTAWIGIPKITFPSPRTSPWDSWIILVP